MAFNTKTGTALRDMIENLGSKGTIRTVREMVEKDEIKPTDFELKEILLACETADLRTEANTSDLFPLLTGELINAQVIAGYANSDLIGDKLVTTIPSKLQKDKLASIAGLDGPEFVPENAEYNEKKTGKIVESQ